MMAEMRVRNVLCSYSGAQDARVSLGLSLKTNTAGYDLRRI